MDNRLPLNKALLWILLSTLFVSGSAAMSWLYFLHIRHTRETNEQYHIIAIVQNSKSTDQLKSVYLSELLHLSLNDPTNLYQFDLYKGTLILQNSPLIKRALIKKIPPGALYIDYEMRHPIAYLGEFENTAIDQEGFLFPFSPFYTPKKLPIFLLGINDKNLIWGSNILALKSTKKALFLLNEWNTFLSLIAEIKTIDVSQMDADSAGQKEIVMKVELKPPLPKNECYLRMNAEHTKNSLLNFLALCRSYDKEDIRSLLSNASVIDLRITDLAFISNKESP